MTFEAALDDTVERPGVEEPLVPVIENTPLCAFQLAFSSSLLLGYKVFRCTCSQFGGIQEAKVDNDRVAPTFWMRMLSGLMSR